MDACADKVHDNERRSLSAAAFEAEDAIIGGCANEIEDRRDDIPKTQKKSFLVKYRDRVYDICDFLSYHPGGKNTLMRYQNRILDRALERFPHSKSAYHLLEEFTVHHQEKYDECEDLINWDAPILWQVGGMGDRYWEWVNLPVYRPIRFFQSDILEMLSFTPWYAVPIVWLPVLAYFFYVGCASNASPNIAVTSQQILQPFVLGILLWTIGEYFVHRYVFHLKPLNSKLLITLHFLFHGNHHKAPLDGRRLVFPPTFSLAVATIVWQIYKAILPRTIVYLVGAGTITGYLCYDLVHYYLHNGAPKVGSYLYTMKRRHNYHHFLYHSQGFGVTSELWDRLLKTDLTLRKLSESPEW